LLTLLSHMKNSERTPSVEAALVRQELAKRGECLADLARSIGKTRTMVCYVLNGDRVAKATREKIEANLGIEIWK